MQRENLLGGLLHGQLVDDVDHFLSLRVLDIHAFDHRTLETDGRGPAAVGDHRDQQRFFKIIKEETDGGKNKQNQEQTETSGGNSQHDAAEDKGELSEDYLIDCDLLILDDIGTELSNSFTNSALYTVINERHLKRRPTIISTNLSLEELENRYSERIFSRISKDYAWLELIGSDIRRK